MMLGSCCSASASGPDGVGAKESKLARGVEGETLFLKKAGFHALQPLLEIIRPLFRALSTAVVQR
jgi:hypothetical protein